MDDSIKKYLEDMLQAISEIEMAENRFGRQYDIFENDVIFGHKTTQQPLRRSHTKGEPTSQFAFCIVPPSNVIANLQNPQWNANVMGRNI